MYCNVMNQFLDVSCMNFVIQRVKSHVLVVGEIWTLPQMQRFMQFKTRLYKYAVIGSVNYMFKVLSYSTLQTLRD